MSKVEIYFDRICPHLNQNPTDLEPLVIDLETDLQLNERCDVGEKQLDHEVMSDLMLNPQKVKVKIRCMGCRFQHGGFARTVETVVKP